MKRIGFRGYIAIVVGILIIAVGILYFFKPFDGRCTLQRMLSVGKSGGEQKLSDTSLSGSCSCNGHNRDAPL